MTYPISDDFCTRYNCSKPPSPYVVGTYLEVHSHNPPLPEIYVCSYNPTTARERKLVHPVDRCLYNPPAEGSYGSITANLEILETVSAGDGHSAQLVVVEVRQVFPKDALPTDKKLLAKIYDPLFFDHEQDDANPFLVVDSEYTHEAATYPFLSDLQGTLIPRYYGSLTLSWPVYRGLCRSVRLILTEIIPGASMDRLNPAEFSQSDRQAIMRKVIDAENLIYTYNVRHGDLHPRNILLLDSGESSHGQKIVVVDFGRSIIGRKLFPCEKVGPPGVEISPLLRWHEFHHSWAFFEDWVDWDWQPSLEYEYAGTRASITGHLMSDWLGPSVTKGRPPFRTFE